MTKFKVGPEFRLGSQDLTYHVEESRVEMDGESVRVYLAMRQVTVSRATDGVTVIELQE
jgi:hypothetical protein